MYLIDKLSVGWLKKHATVIATLIAICILAGVAAYLLMHKNKSHEPSVNSVSYVQSKINFEANQNNCKKRLDDLVKTDISKMSPLNAAKVLSQRGNCYYELGKYKEALSTYQDMQKLCKQQTEDMRCGLNADNGVQISKDALNPYSGATNP